MRDRKDIAGVKARPDEEYVSAKELSVLLRISVSSAHRLCTLAGVSKTYLGVGRNSAVRYDALALRRFLEQRTVKSSGCPGQASNHLQSYPQMKDESL